jgi:transcriptional regulator NrdR family protein
MPCKVKKRDGTFEDYVESKVVAGVKRAGATADQAARVGKEVTQKVAAKALITAEELASMVVSTLAKINKTAAEGYVKFRETKAKAKKK